MAHNLKRIKHNVSTVRKSVFKTVPEEEEPLPEKPGKPPMEDLYPANPNGFRNVKSTQSYNRRAPKLPTATAGGRKKGSAK